MKIRNLHVKVLALFLAAAGLATFYYKVTILNLPIEPDTTAQIWTVQARISFTGGNRPIKVDLAIPNETTPGFIVLEEDFISNNYGLSVKPVGSDRRAEWAVRRAKGDQVLYYRLRVSRDSSATKEEKPRVPSYPAVPDYKGVERTAILGLLEEVRRKSADTVTFTRELLALLNTKQPSENIMLLQRNRENELKWAKFVKHVLAGARIPTRLVRIVRLEDGIREALHPWLKVFDGRQWRIFNPHTGIQGIPGDVLIWYRGNEPLLRVKNGDNATLQFSVQRETVPHIMVAEQKAAQIGSGLIEYSLLSLPLHTQNIYQILFIIPIGALVLVLLRSFVGIKTFGTFMPVLIALAFYETQLFWGILLFTLLTALGLSMRFYLDRLKLLMVPRLASVLIVVILLMGVASIVSHELGFERGLSVALFPMVILTMVIERMSLVWEESGAREALIMGSGSLVAAALSYLVMKQELLKHLVFVFPELLLVVLALTLLIGRYTGYRLLELWRFNSLIKEPNKS